MLEEHGGVATDKLCRVGKVEDPFPEHQCAVRSSTWQGCVYQEGWGRFKVRAVACRNFVAERPTASTYASGIDGTQVRATIAKATQHGWQVAGMDVKTAYLLRMELLRRRSYGCLRPYHIIEGLGRLPGRGSPGPDQVDGRV